MAKDQMCAKFICSLFLFLTALACSTRGQGNQLPPKIVSIFRTDYFYPRDATLTSGALINCTAQNGQIQYEWRKDGEVVKNSQFVLIDNSTGVLRFVKMQEKDYGTYQCFATNNYGTSVSKPFRVKEASLESFPINHNQEVQCKQYAHCKVQCQNKPPCVPDSQCKVRWRIGEGLNAYIEIDNRVAVDRNGDLHFLWTNLNDWKGIPYYCEVSHDQLNRSVVGSRTTLKIEEVPMAAETEPFFVFKEDGKTLEGGKGVLRCMFSGYPVPDIEWSSPGQTIIKNTPGIYEISDFGRELTILQSSLEYEGLYKCKGKAKTESLPQNVFLNVTSAPFLIGDNQMRDTNVTEGNNTIFHCEVKSLSKELPPTRPMWKKNGVDLKIDEEKYILTKNNQVLTVTNVQTSDAGVYQCMSENSEGVLLKEAILKVIGVTETTSTTVIILVVLFIIIVAVATPITIVFVCRKIRSKRYNLNNGIVADEQENGIGLLERAPSPTRT